MIRNLKTFVRASSNALEDYKSRRSPPPQSLLTLVEAINEALDSAKIPQSRALNAEQLTTPTLRRSRMRIETALTCLDILEARQKRSPVKSLENDALP